MSQFLLKMGIAFVKELLRPFITFPYYLRSLTICVHMHIQPDKSIFATILKPPHDFAFGQFQNKQTQQQTHSTIIPISVAFEFPPMQWPECNWESCFPKYPSLLQTRDTQSC